MGEPLIFDPGSAEFRRDITSRYARFLREDPVHRLPDGRWLLCRHADISTALTDAKRFRRPQEWTAARHPSGALADWARENMIGMNPPDQTRFRRALMPAFSPKALAELRQTIERLCEALAGRIEADSEVDFIDAFAYPLPIAVICAMLGIPESDRKLFRESTAAIIDSLEISASPEIRRRGAEGVTQLRDYLAAAVDDRAKNPGNDVISLLVAAERQGSLTRSEVVHAAISLLIAGHETTTHLIGNGLVALMQNPGEEARLRAEPALLANAVDEFLRYDPSIYTVFRMNREDVTFGGRTIPEGSFMFLGLAAANRDPEVFPDPGRLDVARKNANRHLSFAGGIHLCLGYALARIEAAIAFEKLLARFRAFEPAAEPVPRDGLMFKGCREIRAVLRAA